MIVLDTHAWVWWASGSSELPPRCRVRVDESSRVGVCAISLWEVAMLVERGRLRFDRDPLLWMDQALALPNVELLALTPQIAVRSAQLGREFQGDPADRMIVAAALTHRAPLVTRDARIRALSAVDCVW